MPAPTLCVVTVAGRVGPAALALPVGWAAADVVEPAPAVTDGVEPPAPEPSGDPTTTSPATPTPTPSPTATPTSTATPTPTTEPEPTSSPEPTPEPTTTAPTVSPAPAPVPTTPTTPAPVAPEPTPGVVAPVVPVWPSRPAVAESTLPGGVVLAAALVLVGAAAGLWWWWRRVHATEGTGADGSGAAAVATAGSVAAGTRTAAAGDDAPTLVLPLPDADDDAPAAPAPQMRPDDATAADPPGADPRDAPAEAAVTSVVTGTLPTVGERPDVDASSARGDETVRFLVRLGEGMVDAGAPIVQVNTTLQRVAAVNGLPEAAVVTFPTALMVSVPQHGGVQTAVSTAGSRALRLDQVGDVLDLANAAARGDVRPRDGLAALEGVLLSGPTSTAWRRAAGYVAVAAGLSLVLGGGWLDVLVAAVLGGAVSLLTTATRRVPAVYQGLLVAVAAFVVAVPVLLLARTGWPVGLLAPLVAPLVVFLPGALLTTGVVDLATRQMIAGSSRLAAGVMQLVLLALGITAAAGLVGVPASEVGSASSQPLGWAGPWVGVLVYAVGVVLHYDAHRAALPWIALVLLVAYAGQVLGGVLLGAVVSSFVGALVMTPVAMLAATRPSGPPFLVTFLPGFWVLVPGALGLVGVTSALGHSTEQAVTTIVTTGVSMVAISLGVLAGLAVGGTVVRRVAPDAPRIV